MSERDLRIRFREVSKAYRRRHTKSFLLKELWPGRTGELDDTDLFWALSDLSFTVDAGEAVAIIGENGSGKSTALRLLAGASHPTKGVVSVRGRIAPILGLGVGFEPDMTASENAYINASLLGLSKEEVRDRLKEILRFADLGDFADVPVRHYSSGMQARLGFGVAMHVDANVVLIDEVLAVGDTGFQARCLTRLRELQRRGVTLLIVTHDLPMARELCSRALWIRGGKLEADGACGDVLDEYEATFASS